MALLCTCVPLVSRLINVSLVNVFDLKAEVQSKDRFPRQSVNNEVTVYCSVNGRRGKKKQGNEIIILTVTDGVSHQQHCTGPGTGVYNREGKLLHKYKL